MADEGRAFALREEDRAELNGFNVEALWASQNVHDGSLAKLSTDDLAQTDAKLEHKQIEAHVLLSVPLLHPVNNLEMQILPVPSSTNSANLNPKSLETSNQDVFFWSQEILWRMGQALLKPRAIDVWPKKQEPFDGNGQELSPLDDIDLVNGSGDLWNRAKIDNASRISVKEQGYYEWKQAGGIGVWRYGGTVKITPFHKEESSSSSICSENAYESPDDYE
ncbi:hypothetical protein Nepgr_010475 [Nepenthes gracilis]|uniref:Uncharacterized protein n=1 Tax=Nepenthes gracilis TaxID=150966 RepID=A0AAD3SDC9_NEPGR|nr:hypothetical protein Nepgr_010475 [Nepenthes gracilis]